MKRALSAISDRWTCGLALVLAAVLQAACSASSAGGPADGGVLDGSAEDMAGSDASEIDDQAPGDAAEPGDAASDPSARLSSLVLSTGTLSPAFAPTTLSYTASVANTFAPVPFTVTPACDNPAATIAVNGTALASGATSAPIALSAGAPTPIDITVAAPNTTPTHVTVVVTLGPDSVYVKASVPHANANFGSSIALSGDTMAVGAPRESSSATGINGNENDTAAPNSGAVYVYTRTAGVWTQQAYIKASNTSAGAAFGGAVALDGDTLVVGSIGEKSNATGIGGNQADTSAASAGAVYVFVRNGTTWAQQAYLKASNSRTGWSFGSSVALTGNDLAVGAYGESSNAVGVDGDQTSTSAPGAGAVYLFQRTGTAWAQQHYLKASNARSSSSFGARVALTTDTLVVSATGENSAATGIGGNQSDTSQSQAGAAYVFIRSGGSWMQQAYLKASNARFGSRFGSSLALDGDTLVVGASSESSNAKGVDGNQADFSAANAGAAYVFHRSGTTWSQQAYLKASNTVANGAFGSGVALSGDALFVGATGDASNAKGLDGSQGDASAANSGAVYVFARTGTTWTQRHYVKSSNTRTNSMFGMSVAFSGGTLAVGAWWESGASPGIGGNQADTSKAFAGAAYVIR